MPLIWKGSKILLLVLLASLLSVISSISKNPHYDKFLREHVDNPINNTRADYCDFMMWKRRMSIPCKQTNSFIHETPERVKQICGWGGTYYWGGNYFYWNRLSKFNVSVTTCFLQRATPSHCSYTSWTGRRQVVIGCNKEKWPVHFEETNFM